MMTHQKSISSVNKYKIMKTVSNEPSGLLVDSLNELPLFATYCHSLETEAEAPMEIIEDRLDMLAGASLSAVADVTVPPEPACAEVRARVVTAPSEAVAGVASGKDMPKPDRVLTAAAIKATITSWTDLDIRKRRNWSSSVGRAERIIYAFEAERPPREGVDRWSCTYLNEILWAKPAAYTGIEESTLAATVSDLRQILIRLGRHADAGPRRNVLSPAWAALYAALPAEDRQRGLVRFMRFLTLEGIEPEAVTADLLDRFDSWIRTQMLAENIVSVTRKTASGWNWARTTIPGWPEVEFVRPDMRDQYTVPIEAMPASFQEDVARFFEGLRGGNRRNPYRDKTTVRQASGDPAAILVGRIRRGRAVSPETVRYRTQQIRCAVAALIDAGVKLESMMSLSELVTPPDRPRIILQFHLDRLKARLDPDPDAPEGDDPTSTHVAGIAELLRIIAVHHVSLPAGEVEYIVDLRTAVRMPRQREMNENIARKLRALNDPDTLAVLLITPDEWMRQIDALDLDPYAAATQAMFALALEIALTVPARRRNLIGLHRDRDIVRDHRTGKAVGMHVAAGKTKTRKRPLLWEFPPRLVEMIARYERDFLPPLAEEGNRFLFPGLNGRHRDLGDFADNLSRRVEREIGADFNLHLVRHLTAYRILKRRPGAYELVSRVLGHASTVTTRTYYCGLEMIFAVREATRLLELDRIEARPTQARIAVTRKRLRGRRRNTPKPPVAPSRERNDDQET